MKNLRFFTLSTISEKTALGARGRSSWQSGGQEGSARLVRGSLPRGLARCLVSGLEFLPPLLGCLEAPKLPSGGALGAEAHLHEPESHFPPNWQIIWILLWAGQDHIPPPMNPVTSTYNP